MGFKLFAWIYDLGLAVQGMQGIGMKVGHHVHTYIHTYILVIYVRTCVHVYTLLYM